MQLEKASVATAVAFGAKTVDKLGLFAKAWEPIDDTLGPLKDEMRVFRNVLLTIVKSALMLAKVSVDKDVHPSNCPDASICVLFRYVAEPRDVQFVKLLPYEVVVLYVAGIRTVRNAVQPWNTYPPILATFPRVTVDRFTQFWNPYPLIIVKLVGELKEEMAVPWNVVSPIDVGLPWKSILFTPDAAL